MEWRALGLILLGGCVTLTADKPGGADDTGEVDSADSDAPRGDTFVSSRVSVEIIEPPYVVEEGTSEALAGQVLGPDDVVVDVVSDLDGALPSPALGTNQSFAVPLGALSPGNHALTVTATSPSSGASDEALVLLGVCTFPEVQTFDDASALGGWSLFGNAYLDAGGWLEITGNAGSRSGHIYWTTRPVKPGDFSIAFDFATGGGGNGGADGYAVNIVAVPTIEELESYIDATANGGCLGYGSSGPCGGHAVTSLHVELDTWYNPEYADQSDNSHIAIARNGDPSDVLLYIEIPFEDLTWRRVEVRGQGTVLTVLLNGVVVASKDIPNFRFEGGFLGVSGSTGWAYNYHRFDNLEVRDRCEVP